MIVPVILFIFFIMVYVIISDVFTILFRLTGLSAEKARFQVISLLTNSGFTTAESEIIVNSPVRRKLATIIMLFGYGSTVTIVSVIVNVILSMDKAEIEYVTGHIIFAVVMFIIFNILRNRPSLKSCFDRYIEKLGTRVMFGTDTNPVTTMDYYGPLSVSQVILNKVPSELKDVTLLDSGLKENYGVMVMAIKDSEGNYEQASGRSVLKEKDTLIVLGNRKKIRAAFEKA